MSQINHPFFGKVGAFWIPGHNGPFYSLKDAQDHQYKNGGDILDHDGNLLYPDRYTDCPPCPQCQCRMHAHQELMYSVSTCAACGFEIRNEGNTEIRVAPVPKKGFWSNLLKWS